MKKFILGLIKLIILIPLIWIASVIAVIIFHLYDVIIYANDFFDEEIKRLKNIYFKNN